MRESASNNTGTSSNGGCPVQISRDGSTSSTSSKWSFSRLVTPSSWRTPTSPSSTATATATATNNSASNNISSCPVQSTSKTNKTKSAPASVEESAHHAQTPHPSQRHPLSTHRMISSIPRSIPNNSSEKAPHHQPKTTSPATSACDDKATDTSNNWVYPSEQQFFNAMKRKGWQLPPGSEMTMPQVVQIHNAVNERGWSQIIQWERMRGNDEPKLVRFLGRPSDKSPRALWNEWILMKKAPFDRHDWYVVHGQNEEIPERRYVIDFYNGKESTSERGSNVMGASMDPTQMQNRPPSMFLDVRPALDDADAVRDRAKMFCKEALPGLFSLWQTYQSQSLLNNSTRGSSTSGNSSGGSSGGGRIVKEAN